ncbi:hypothetical protein V2J09_007286, partial [Rumex salicifolius]
IQAKKQEYGLLRDEIRRELLKTIVKPLEHLKLVDTLEQLGVAYHFENVIKDTLRHIYNIKERVQEENILDLYYTSLKSCRRCVIHAHKNHVAYVFRKFMDEQGNFLETLKDDAESMLSLYEATHVREHGEDILEKALEFSKNHLKAIVDDTQTMHPFESRILRALKYPIQKSVTRLEPRHFISFYEQDPCHNHSMLRFAKLDCNLLQSMYKEEIEELTGVETYFQPEFATARKIYTKTFIMLTILDDLYDGYGTIEELGAFTKAIKRWDKGCIYQLSGYMREFYEILYDTFEDFENEMAKVGRKNYIDYLRKEIINLSQAYMMVLLSLLENKVEENIAKKNFETASTYGKIQKIAFIIGRFMNGIGDYEVREVLTFV